MLTKNKYTCRSINSTSCSRCIVIIPTKDLMLERIQDLSGLHKLYLKHPTTYMGLPKRLSCIQYLIRDIVMELLALQLEYKVA